MALDSKTSTKAAAAHIKGFRISSSPLETDP
jgi:hypothetical protein